MKKIVYVVIGLMALVLVVNLSATGKNATIKIENKGEIVELNPFY